MTSKPPSRRLIDVLKQNSPDTLRRHAADLAAATSALPPEATQTRFLRNSFLISPKFLRVLPNENLLRSWKVWALYKPPFCPMRAADAVDNYHRVSVESFVKAAFRSRDIFPTVQSVCSPAEIHLRVLNDLSTAASGPVLICISDSSPLATSLHGVTMDYDVLVAGHVGSVGVSVSIPTEDLFPATKRPNEEATKESDSDAGCNCRYEVRQHGFYASHAVSLLRVTIESPTSSQPPMVESFVQKHLKTCVLGDPSSMDELHNQTSSSLLSSSSSVAASLRGDCDFPRVFVHLCEVRLPSTNAATPTTGADESFHCRKCFDPLIQKSRSTHLKRQQVKVLDGSWTPEAEFL